MRSLADLGATRRVAVPVLAYLLVTLVLPALHGAAGRPGFAHHAACVLAGCLAVVALALALDLLRPGRRTR